MDKNMLEYKRKKKGISVEKLCITLGISKSAYYRKCKGTSEFTRTEIQKIIDCLELDNPMDIFFTKEVS